MPLKTAFRLLQVFILSMLLSAGFAQDSIKTKPRPVISSKPKPVQQTSANPASTNSGQLPKPQPAVPVSTISTDKSINGQYQFILSKVYRYQQPMISEFYRSVQDTLRIQHNAIVTLKKNLSDQAKNVSSLKTDLNDKEESLNTTSEQINNINFLGMPVAKTTYNIMMWGLVIVLGILAATIIFLSGNARREAHYRTKLYNELEEEYKGYKIKANDKEKKLSRELQTVRNKLEDITGNPEY